MGAFKTRWSLAALVASAAVLLASLVLRPMWRDEYWALYFSGLGLSLTETVNAVRTDVHPPLYFVLLHFWRMVSEHELWVRVFNIVVIFGGALGAWLLRGSRRDETLTFLFLCATSYWLIFYGVEARMMGMEFVLCALSVLVIRNALDQPVRWIGPAILFCALGLVAASSHFFGALWFAIAGFCTGIALLQRGQYSAFVGWGVASVIAIAPAVAWILWTRPYDNPGAGDVQPWAEALANGANQFFRGLIVKTFVGNLAATTAAALCVSGLARRRDPFTAAIFLAALGTVVAAFAVHLLWVNLIKERAFIVIMPAVLYLIAQALHSVRPEQRFAQRLINATPIVAIVMLPLFSVEYFKDRERIGDVRAYIARHEEACANQPIVAVYRPSDQAHDFSEFFTRAALSGAGGEREILLVDARALVASNQTPPASTCPLKALALSLSRGEDATHAEARAELRAAGVNLDRLEEWSVSRSRALLYVEPGTADEISRRSPLAP